MLISAWVSGEKAFQWTVALVLFGVLFLGVSDTQLVAPLLPLIARDFQITPGNAGMIVTTYSLAAAVFALLMGPLIRSRWPEEGTGLWHRVVRDGIFYYIHGHVVHRITYCTDVDRTFRRNTFNLLAIFCRRPLLVRRERTGHGRPVDGIFCGFRDRSSGGSDHCETGGWHSVFAAFAVFAIVILASIFAFLPDDSRRTRSPYSFNSLRQHFYKSDRLAGMAAAFLTSGGIVGFLTYVGAWLATEHGIGSRSDRLAFHGRGDRCGGGVTDWRMVFGSCR